MAKVRITGLENLQTAPSLYLPNRVDAVVLPELERLLGGIDNVAYMVEEVLAPEEDVKRFLKKRHVVSFNFRKANVKSLREQLLNQMAEGRDVVFVPGRPNSIMGCTSDVPMPFMMQLAALHISPVPVFVGHYRENILRAFTSDKTYEWIALSILPKLSPGPLTGERVLEAWMEASATEYERNPILDFSLARLLVEGMRRNGKVEVIDGLDGSSLPFYKVLGVSMALSRELKKMVTEPRLGIILPPGKGGLIANYACILAGIVPVNINYTSSEPAFKSIVRQSGLKHFISARAFMSKLPQFPWPQGDAIIHLDKTLKGIGMPKIAGWVAFARFAPMSVVSMTFNLDARKGDDEAALLFTSGSSGEPKGVAFTHRMVIANMTQILSKASLAPGSKFLCSLPIFHSFGLTISTLLPPIYGFGMVTYPSPLEAKKLNELIEQHKCALVVTTPTFARSMLRRAGAHTYDSVQLFVVGAEKLQTTVAEEFKEKCNVTLLEGYGLTETAPVCGVNLQETGPTPQQPYFVPGYKFGSIGQVLPGLAVRITDPDDDNVRLTLNEQGMIWLKGANVFKGYIGRDDLNEGIFRDGWFKTGDLGKVDLNGILTLGGRRSRFSKVGGEMVPHEVVENAIEDFVPHPEGFTGRAVAVVGVPDAQKGEALVLLSCVHTSQLTQALDEIRSHLVEQGLPRLWCPREIIPVETIPALPTGKMDLRGCQMLANEALGIH
ncbi:MAG: AMP-dependent synthetase [Akkermansiaceae bacterium]|nr:AMP-dependent synthetase [Akkermansiaceae bacterium]